MTPTELFIIAGSSITLILLIFLTSFLFISHKRHNKYIKEKIFLQTQFQQEIFKTQLETHESTLNQISEEIHDNIGQLLSSTKMLLGITERNLDSIPDTLKTAEQTLSKAIQDLRSLSKSLNKEWLHQFNIANNLKMEVERINTSCTIQAEYFTSTTFLPMQAEAQVMLFRIVQEAMQNCIKHANARHITIRTLFNTDHINVTVDDDGNGITKPEQTATGVSMMNMQHRTKLLGGTIAWNALPQGTQVLINLPVQPQQI